MDALIRFAEVAPQRTRLSELGAVRLAAADESKLAQEALRKQVEKEVRAELEAHAQKIFDGARESGHGQGYAAGLEEAKALMDEEFAATRATLKAQVDKTVANLEDAQRKGLSKLEASVGEVAFAAICRLIGHKAASREVVLGFVEQTCAQLRGDAIATVRLHSRDVEHLRGFIDDYVLTIQSLKLQVLPDDTLEMGGCVIEAASGHSDGGLESQLRRLHGVLAGAAQSTNVAAIVTSIPRPLLVKGE